ncbi:hypothetical protein [Streptomyces acidiscabies]|uniref:hypothetical protein n=1 Tax=Streptomyces acidiscabies TaxID=42234 RepID=UPI0038F73A60
MEAVIVVVALVFLALFLLGVWGTVKAVGAVKRGVDRTIGQARRTVEDHTLRAKSLGRIGPAGEIAQLRLTLRTSMRATQDALHAGAAEDESLKESLGLFERLSAHGHQLDDELKRLESDPDRGTLAQRLPELRERTGRITASADSLRWAARDRASRFAEDDLDSLSAQIDVEAGALRHWITDDVPQAGRSGQAGQTWRAGPEGASGETPPPAISPQPPRPAYPWEKKTRPESTT